MKKIICFFMVLCPFFARATEFDIPDPAIRIVSTSYKKNAYKISATEIDMNKAFFVRDVSAWSMNIPSYKKQLPLNKKRLLSDIDNVPEIHSGYFSDNLTDVKTAYQAQPQDINATGSNGMTPLIYAVRFNRMEIVKFLLQSKADVNIGIKIFDTKGSDVVAENVTPLIVAILTDNMDMVKILADAGADINLNATEYTDSGFDVLYSPLMVAIEKDDFNTVKYLVEHGANINFIANEETAPTTGIYITPVTTAIKHDQFKILKFLAGQGASLQGASNYAGVFPPSWEIIEYLTRTTSDDGTKTLKQMLQLRNAFTDIVSKITQKLEFKETDFHMISGTNLHAAISMLSLIALTPEESRETFFKKNISTESLISAFHYTVRELNYRNQLFEETTDDSLQKITKYFAAKTNVSNPNDFNTYTSTVLDTKFRTLIPLVFPD